MIAATRRITGRRPMKINPAGRRRPLEARRRGPGTSSPLFSLHPLATPRLTTVRNKYLQSRVFISFASPVTVITKCESGWQGQSRGKRERPREPRLCFTVSSSLQSHAQPVQCCSKNADHIRHLNPRNDTSREQDTNLSHAKKPQKSRQAQARRPRVPSCASASAGGGVVDLALSDSDNVRYKGNERCKKSVTKRRKRSKQSKHSSKRGGTPTSRAVRERVGVLGRLGHSARQWQRQRQQ